MSIPNLPTDNLYKFIALSGVAMFIIINLYSFKNIIEIEEDIRKLKLESKIYKKESGFIDEDINNFNTDGLNSISEVINQLDPIKIKLRELAIKEIRIKHNLEEVEKRNNDKYLLLIIWSATMIISISMMVYGFSYWYKRVQKFLDIKLKNESSEN